MNKIFTVLALCITLFAAGCHSSKVLDGKEYDTYGLFDREEIKDKCVHYELVQGNVFWSVVLAGGLFIGPIWLLGFDLYEPDSLIPGCHLNWDK